MSIPVCWHSQERDAPGIYNCTAQIVSMFGKYDCVHYAARNKMPDVDGAVVVVHGGREPGSLDKLQMDIEDLRWVILIFLGDEEAVYPAEKVEHPNKKVWVQEPLPGKHDFADRFILDGWTPHTHKNIVKCEKDLDWVLACQMTHERRWACRNALQTIDWGGIIVESKGYTLGVSIEEYYRLLCRAHIAPCPSGPFSPDSARVAEALECGCVPILDDLSPTRREPGFWNMVLGPHHPLPVIHDWANLPGVIKSIKSDWVNINAECQEWWSEYKEAFNHWLREDIDELCKT